MSVAPAAEPPPLDARLLALCGDIELMARDISRLIIELDALRRRSATLERRMATQRRGRRHV